MRSRGPAFILLVLSLLLLLSSAGSIGYKVYKDNQYLNQEIGKMKDGTPITRKVLLDMLILKAAREAQPQVEPNGR